MTHELNFYTGQLEYRGISFSFAFDKTELRLAEMLDQSSSKIV